MRGCHQPAPPGGGASGRGTAGAAIGFAARLESLGPFERPPRLAVAVSGGGDSLALCLLADRWARARGGNVLGLTVDHALRPESAAEAAQVGRWLAGRGIAHRILLRTGPLTGGLQQAARTARYALLEQACREAGILHLLVGHTREDQAETVALRQAHGSGPAGLAAMAPLVESRHLRLIRPLLGVARDDLRTFLAEAGQDWIEDPSNQDPRFERVRLRRAGAGGRAGLLDLAAGKAAMLADLDASAGILAARHVRLFREGYARLDPALFDADRDAVTHLLSRLCRTIGGLAYPPAPAGLAALAAGLAGGKSGQSLGRCVFARADGTILVRREARLLPGPVAFSPVRPVRWDDRWEVAPGAGELALGPVGRAGMAQLEAARKADLLSPSSIPKVVWPVLPAIYRRGAISAVPHLRYNVVHEPALALDVLCLEFRPAHALMPPGRCLV